MKALILVSGGPDSVFLFHYFLKLKNSCGADFSVLHVNHHLRGAESDADEAFVRGLAACHGVTCFIRDFYWDGKGNLQDLARRERLKFCFELQFEKGFTHAVTAHHVGDVIETLVMRKSRGAGLSGLTGIRAESVLANPKREGTSLTILRPLLDVNKTEMVAFLKTDGLEYRTDSSNLSQKYLRNRVRAHLDCIPSPAHHRILELARVLQCIDDYFRERSDFTCGTYRDFVAGAIWESWPEELRFRFFARKMRQYGYRKQVDKHHFHHSLKPRAKLVLDQAVFTKDKKGCRFYSLV